MGSTGRIVLLAALLLAGLPGPAAAKQGFWEMLEALSGPGPFTGGGVNLPLVCGTTTNREGPWVDHQANAGFPCWNDEIEPDRRFRRWFGSVRLARYRSLDNDLQYASGVFDTSSQREDDVVWWQIGASFTWAASRAIDLRSGVDANLFSSRRQVFESFSRPSLTIVQVDWRPVREGWARIFSLGIGTDVMLGTLDAIDFGAVPGTFRVRNEVRTRAAFAVDFGRL